MYPGNPGILSILESTPMAWGILGYPGILSILGSACSYNAWRDILGYPRNPGILSILGLACRYMYTPIAWDILGNPGILGILGSTCSYPCGIWDILGYSRNPRSFYMAYAVP